MSQAEYDIAFFVSIFGSAVFIGALLAAFIVVHTQLTRGLDRRRIARQARDVVKQTVPPRETVQETAQARKRR